MKITLNFQERYYCLLLLFPGNGRRKTLKVDLFPIPVNEVLELVAAHTLIVLLAGRGEFLAPLAVDPMANIFVEVFSEFGFLE